MRILFLTTQLPYPPKSGGVIKSWRLLEHWARTEDVALIHPLKDGDIENMEGFKKEALPIKEHIHHPVSVGRSAMNLLKSYMGHATLNVYRNHSNHIMKEVERLMPTYDILFVDHYELGQYIPRNNSCKVVFHEHNAEYVMWSRLADIEKNPIKKLVLNIESNRIAKAEKDYAGKSDQIWAAPNDRIELERIGVSQSKMRTTYHLGEDFMMDAPDIVFEETEKKILFVGTLTWEANVDGLLWFFDEIWPRIKEEEGVSLDIIGKNPDPRLLEAAKAEEKVRFLGFVDELEPHYKNSRVFIVPLRFGSGIKVKLLNAMYRGIPTVTTEIGTEGLDVEDGKELFQTQNPEVYASNVIQLLNDKNLWESMMKSSRRKADKYTWKTLLSEHDLHLKELIQ